MKLMNRLFIAPALALAIGTVYADTSTSNKGKAAMEKNAYPSAPKQDEERTQAHSQPGVPDPRGIKPRKKTEADVKNKSGKSGASVGSSPPARHNAATVKDGNKARVDGDRDVPTR
jgi:hypothetical protein